MDVVISTASALIGYDGFTYLGDMELEDPTLLAVTPGSGPASGGSLVTLVAKGLTEVSDATVSFGGAQALIKNVDAEGHTVLVKAPGPSQDVTLSNSNGSAALRTPLSISPLSASMRSCQTLGRLMAGRISPSRVGFEAGLQLRIGALPASN